MNKFEFKMNITMFKTFQIQAALNLDDFIEHKKEEIEIPKRLEAIGDEYGKDSLEFEKYLDEKGEYFYLLRDRIIGNAINCVVYSAFAIEAYINSYLLSNMSRNQYNKFNRNKSIVEKISLGYNAVKKKVFPENELNKIKELFNRRNKIARFKHVSEEVEKLTDKDYPSIDEIIAEMSPKTNEELFGVPFNDVELRKYVFILDKIKKIMPLSIHFADELKETFK